MHEACQGFVENDIGSIPSLAYCLLSFRHFPRCVSNICYILMVNTEFAAVLHYKPAFHTWQTCMNALFTAPPSSAILQAPTVVAVAPATTMQSDTAVALCYMLPS